MTPAADWLLPDWPAPARVKACVTTRAGGVSLPPFDTFNLGDHVEDDLQAVTHNRQRLSARIECAPAWLRQVHGVVVADADPASVAEADGELETGLGKMGGKVLIVDDVATNRIVMKVKLTAAGYLPVVAADGTSCLALAKAQAPALILLDCNLPDMPGTEVLRHLRADRVHHVGPVAEVAASQGDRELRRRAPSSCRFRQAGPRPAS